MDVLNFFEQLDQSTDSIVQAAMNCPTEQLHTKEDGQWSVLDIIEHLCRTDKVIFTLIAKPSDTIHADSEIIGNDKLQKFLVEQRSRKITSPDMLQPKGEIKDLQALLELFRQQRDTLKNDLLQHILVIDNRVHHHPFLGAMTIADWLNFTTHHTRRHLQQIRDMVGR